MLFSYFLLPLQVAVRSRTFDKEFISIQKIYRRALLYFYLKDMKVAKTLFILALVFISFAADEVYERVLLTDPKAKCLDGSQGAYYISKGDATKVLLFFEGGGWCGDADLSSTLENCYQRSKSNLGSSTNYQETMTESYGIVSRDQDNFFVNWTKVYLKYCDGSGHQGSRSEPILYKGAQLYFRGQDIAVAQFESINQRLGIFEGKITNMVLSGQSAGGLAAFHWVNYLQGRVSPLTTLKVVPDSGVFLDYPNMHTKTNTYRAQFQNLLKISNQQTGTPIPQCNLQNKDALWRCMFAQNIIQYISTPMFAAQSLYDSWSLYFIVGIRCITDDKSLLTCSGPQRSTIEDYHRRTQEILFKIASKNENGIWAPVCINHCYLTNWYYSSKDYRIPADSQTSLMQALASWITGEDENPRHMDFGEWPDNRPCSGLSLR